VPASETDLICGFTSSFYLDTGQSGLSQNVSFFPFFGSVYKYNGLYYPPISFTGAGSSSYPVGGNYITAYYILLYINLTHIKSQSPSTNQYPVSLPATGNIS
jgi:hypothetical protein